MLLREHTKTQVLLMRTWSMHLLRAHGQEIQKRTRSYAFPLRFRTHEMQRSRASRARDRHKIECALRETGGVHAYMHTQTGSCLPARKRQAGKPSWWRSQSSIWYISRNVACWCSKNTPKRWMRATRSQGPWQRVREQQLGHRTAAVGVCAKMWRLCFCRNAFFYYLTWILFHFNN